MPMFYLSDSADCRHTPHPDDAFAFELSIEALRYVLPHRATDGIRPTLQNIYLDPSGALVATDGYTLAAYRNGHACPIGRILAADWGEVARLCKGKGLPVVLVRVERDAITLSRPGSPMTISADFPDDRYPDWRTVIPRDNDMNQPLPTIALDAALLTRFRDPARKPREPARMALSFQAVDRAIVVHNTNPNCYGLVMPCRVGVIPETDMVPDWLAAPSIENIKAAA